MAPWVKALLDPSPVHSEETKKQIASPPPFIFAAGDKPNLGPPSTPANAGRGRGRPRAGSPVKGTPAAGKASSPRKRATKAQKEAKEAAKEVNAAAARQASESLHAAVDGMSEAATTLVKKGEKALESSPMVNGDKTPAKKSKKKEKEEGGSSSGAKKKAIKAEPKEEKVTVEVQTGGGGAQVNGDVDGGEQTSVKVRMPPASPELPLPQSTEHVIATAKEMVAEARKLEAESAGGGAKAGGAKGRAKGKRKLDEVKDSEDDEAEDKVRDEPSAKRARVAEQEVQRQTVRNRALLGAGLTLAIGYVGRASVVRELLRLTILQCRHSLRAWRLILGLELLAASPMDGSSPFLLKESSSGSGLFWLPTRFCFVLVNTLPFVLQPGGGGVRSSMFGDVKPTPDCCGFFGLSLARRNGTRLIVR